MLSRDYLFRVGFDVLFNFAIWGGELTIYLVHQFSTPYSETELSPTLALASLVLTIIAFTMATLDYAIWEYRYGSGFSYFLPRHGAARVDDFIWRRGILAKTLFLARLITLVLDIVFTHAYPNFTSDGLLILTPISRFEMLIVAVSKIFFGMVLLLFVHGGQFYVVPKVLTDAQSK